MHFDTEVVFLDRNDRNNSDNTRQRQGQQSFHRNPQRPPAPDYRSRQRDNSSYDRSGERSSRQEGSSRMNSRPGQNPRNVETKYDLPDRPQQRRDPRESIMNDEQMNQDRFSRDPGRQSAQQVRQGDNRRFNRQDTGRQRDGRSQSREDWQREPGNYSRRNDGQREPRRFDQHNPGRQNPQDVRNNQDRQRDSRRFEEQDQRPNTQGSRRDARIADPRGAARMNRPGDRRDRMGNPARSTLDEDFYNSPRASDPRRREDRSTRYDGMSEGAVDLGSFDINYKGDNDASKGLFKAPSISTSALVKPKILAVFAVAAVLITVVIFVAVSKGDKNKTTDLPESKTKYEYNIPETVNIGGIEIKTDSDYIELSGLNITDIGDLSYCYLVNSLFINGNAISDLTPIGDCISLKTIDVSTNQISDISALSHLNQLEDIDVSTNQIADLTPLSKLQKLERLSAGKNRISDLTPLADCSALRQLIISDNSVSDLLPISGLANLTTLEAANNQITDISSLSTLPNISTLNLSGNQITNVKALKSLTSLTMLDLSNNPISDISGIGSLKGLLELNLTGTKVSKEDLEKLKKDLSGCAIRK